MPDRLSDLSPSNVLMRGLLELFKLEFLPPSLSSLVAFSTIGLQGMAALRNELAESSIE